MLDTTQPKLQIKEKKKKKLYQELKCKGEDYETS